MITSWLVHSNYRKKQSYSPHPALVLRSTFPRTLCTYLYILRVHCKGASLQDIRRLCLLPRSPGFHRSASESLQMRVHRPKKSQRRKIYRGHPGAWKRWYNTVKVRLNRCHKLKPYIYPFVSRRAIFHLRRCGVLRSQTEFDLYYHNLGMLCDISAHTYRERVVSLIYSPSLLHNICGPSYDRQMRTLSLRRLCGLRHGRWAILSKIFEILRWNITAYKTPTGNLAPSGAFVGVYTSRVIPPSVVSKSIAQYQILVAMLEKQESIPVESYVRFTKSYSSGLGYCGANESEVALYAARHSSTLPVNSGRVPKISLSKLSHSSEMIIL